MRRDLLVVDLCAVRVLRETTHRIYERPLPFSGVATATDLGTVRTIQWAEDTALPLFANQ